MLSFGGTAVADSALPRSPQEARRIAAALRIDPGQAHPYEAMPGGKATLTGRFAAGRAFALPMQGLEPAPRMQIALGEALFQRLWAASPSSTKASDGLGPRYNARSCALCHPGNGRGAGPQAAGPLPMALVLRLSVRNPAQAAQGAQDWLASLPHPVYGTQMQTDAVPGLRPEATPEVRYSARQVVLADGQRVSLRGPDYVPGVDLGADAQISPRLAPPLVGMGLIAAIPAADILAGADPEDRDGDGISGRANWVPVPGSGTESGTETRALGRFGWKAGIATLDHQVADAFAHDIGISSPILTQPWGDCTPAQTGCRTAPHGDGDARGTELDATGLALTTAYVAGLAVPPRSGDPAAHVPGRDLFVQAGCAACHRPAYVTERRPDDPLRSFQMIWPWSDFLLHDMGPGLADHRPEHRATGREWRTPPLWGIGRAKQVLDGATYLHDGRARSILEAILWHGGEAAPARHRFEQMPNPDRDALIAFLESL